VADANEVELARVAFDLATMFWFMDRDALVTATDHLNPGGMVLAEVYTPTHRDRLVKPKNLDLTLDRASAQALLPDYEFLLLEEAWRDGRHALRLAAKKPG
jgi:hypothetical protein